MTRQSPEDEAEDEVRLYELATNTVVMAGAGTGKTHRLTGLYLHLVAGLTALGGEIAPPSIVATTFTREAAGEMRSRIEHRLRRLAVEPLAVIADAGGTEAAWAAEMLRTCARRGVPEPSRATYRRALDALPRATITTFHAWAGEIVRAHPIEARVPPGFVLLEPEDADALMARAAIEVVSAWADDADEARRAAARTFLASGGGPLEECVIGALTRANEEGLDAQALPLADDEAALRGAFALRARMFDVVAEVAAARGATRDARGAEALDAGARARAHAEALARGEDARTHGEGFAAAVKDLHDTLRGAFSTAKQRLDEALGRGKNVQERALDVLEAPERCLSARHLGEHARAMLSDIARKVAADKRRENALDFSDVLRAARDLLLEHPAIQAEIAGDVRALLVDEFQDTNALQRDLVYLVRQHPDAIASRPAGALPEPHTLASSGLFLVGDRKQSIYGFRGADVAVFQQMAVEIAGEPARAMLGLPPAEAPPVAAQGALVSLSENRRSLAEILRFVNAVADADMRGSDAMSALERVRFDAATESLRPVRDAELPQDAQSTRVKVPKIALPEAAASAHSDLSTDLVAALAMAAELRTVLDDPNRLGLADLRPRDVAILIRSYKILPALELALGVHGIEHAVAAGRGLYATTEAGDLEALVRLAVDRTDRHALLSVLRGPLVALSDRTLLTLCGEHGLELPPTSKSLDLVADEGERRRIERLQGVLADLSMFRGRLSAATALHRAIETLGLERTLALVPAGEARIRDLRKLLEVAERFPSLAPFARHLARARQGEVDEARGAVFDRDEDVVRVMTIHAAKGLEFRLVVVMQLEHHGKRSESAPFLVRRGAQGLCLAARMERPGGYAFGDGGRALVDRAVEADRAERQRLSYVALTRARDALYAVAAPRKKGKRPDEQSAAASVEKVLERHPQLASRPSLEPQAIAGPERRDVRAIVEPPRAFGDGPIVASPVGSVVIATSLADFEACPRRFRLLHLAGLSEHAPRVAPIETLEPLDREDSEEGTEAHVLDADALLGVPVVPPPSDARAQGTLAHLALERAPLRTAVGEGAQAFADSFLRGEGYDPRDEVGQKVAARVVRFLGGRYAASLLDAGVEVRREHPFLVTLPSGVALRGTIDLLVTRRVPPGGIEIVDYKSGVGGPEQAKRYALQLRAYAAAIALEARARGEDETEILAGLVFLGRGDGAPLWLERGQVHTSSWIESVDAVARALLTARAAHHYPAVPRPRCEALHCGFLPLCHERC